MKEDKKERGKQAVFYSQAPEDADTYRLTQLVKLPRN